YPVLGSMPVQTIETPHVLAALKPIWKRIPRSANDVAGFIHNVLSWAKSHGYREGDNPASWEILRHVLAPPPDIRPTKHLGPLPNGKTPDLMKALRQEPGPAAGCLEFMILTAVRPGAAKGATWQEIDFDARIWTVPGERAKRSQRNRHKSFRVPL